MPHANTVSYANDAVEIFFVLVVGTQVVRNINDNAYVSFTIDDYTTDWRKARELQGVGRCRELKQSDQAGALGSFAVKFGVRLAVPTGLVFAIRPLEVHFVDYTYEVAVAAQPIPPPVITSRVYQIEEPAPGSGQRAVSTSLNRRTVDAGEVIFRPGDPPGQYYVVLEGEVEVRAEGHGADQTVTRVGPGQMFGDQAALRGQRGALTAYAITPVVTLAVERSVIRDLLLPPRT